MVIKQDQNVFVDRHFGSYISRVNWEEHGTKVETVRHSPVNLDGQASTKSVYGTISSLL